MDGKRLKSARMAKGLTQIQLAQRVSTSQSYISEIEVNDRDPSIEMLNTISEALGVTPAFLLGESLQEPPGREAADPRLRLVHDMKAAPGLRDMAGDAALCSILQVQPWEFHALRSIDVPVHPDKEGYLALLFALRSVCVSG